MGRFILLAIALASGMGAPQPQRQDDQLVRNYIDAVRTHHPGRVDAPLLSIARLDPHDIDYIRRNLKGILKDVYPRAEGRNDTLRRAALFHMDIALLMPEAAAEFTQDDVTPKPDPYATKPQVRHEADAVVFSVDGEYMATAQDSAHWWMASQLLKGILPHAGSDPFVARWHRAVIATFESARMFGSAFYAATRALETLPHDPWVLFYAGALHDANASSLIQSIPATRPAMAKELKTPSPQKEWGLAERYFRESVEAGGPPDARVHLGRVLGHLGKHDEAASVLRSVLPSLTDASQRYLANLFLGTEEAALGHTDAARAALEEAARLIPTAQSPLVALSDVNWQAGNRAAALQALTRIRKLPSAGDRQDPWWRYYYAFADDAEEQVAAVRAMVDRNEQP